MILSHDCSDTCVSLKQFWPTLVLLYQKTHKSLLCENEVLFHPHLGCGGGVWLNRRLPVFHRNVLSLSLQSRRAGCLQLCEDEDSTRLKQNISEVLNIRKYVTLYVILEEMELMDEAYDGSWMKYLHRT